MRRPPHSSPDPSGAGGQNDPGGIADEFRLLTTDEGRRLLEEAAELPSIGPTELTRLRKLAPAGPVSAAVRLALARRKAAGKFERGDRMWVEPVGVEQATAEPVARHKALRFQSCPIVVNLCAGSAAMRSPWPGTRGWSPWTSIRGCAGGSGGTPKSTRSLTTSWRSRHGPSRSRSRRAPASTSTPIVAPLGDRRARALEDYAPDPPRGPSSSNGSPAGRSRSPRPPIRAALPAGLGLRGRADQPPRRVQGGDRLVRRAGRVPAAGDPAARVRHLDRPRQHRSRAARGVRSLRLDLRPGPLVDPRRAARRVRPFPSALAGRRGRGLPDRPRDGRTRRSCRPSPCARSRRWTSGTCGG